MENYSIAILTKNSTYFAAPVLAQYLKCPLYVIYNNENNFMDGVQGIKFNNIINCDILIIIGYNALKAIESQLYKYKKVVYIVSDSNSCRFYKTWNHIVEKNNIKVFVMPDKIDYCTNSFIPIYQALNISGGLNKFNKFTITHSPRIKEKIYYKGTNQIQSIILELQNKYDFDFKIITGMSYKEAQEIKSKSHLFIDQLIFENKFINQSRWGGNIIYKGGLGKSGLEAMCMGVCTITSGEFFNTMPYFEPPPVLWTSYDSFYNDVKNIILNEELRNEYSIKQKTWCEKHILSDFMPNLLISNI